LQKPLRNGWYISFRIGSKVAGADFWNTTVILLLLVASLAYSLFLYAYLSHYAAGADASGYLNFSRLLTHDEVLAPVRTLSGHAVAAFGAGTYQPQGFPERR
jgi:hypothetical protein